MELIKFTCDNLEKEHICCAIANNKEIKYAMQNETTDAYYAMSANDALATTSRVST